MKKRFICDAHYLETLGLRLVYILCRNGWGLGMAELTFFAKTFATSAATWGSAVIPGT